jgi:hypothetical protein
MAKITLAIQTYCVKPAVIIEEAEKNPIVALIRVDLLLAATQDNRFKYSDNRIVHRRNKVISISIGRPSWFLSSEYIVTDIENEKIMPSIKGSLKTWLVKLMT